MRALIFDLDGTLTDTVYAHVIAWQRSFAAEDIHVTAWNIHTKIGLSGEELAIVIGRAVGKSISKEQAVAMDKRHADILKELLPQPKPLPGATALLRRLRELDVPYGIATSGDRSGLEEAIRCLGLSDDVTAVCKGDVERAKPEPAFSLACRQ